MNATEQRTHRTVTQDLDGRLRVVETLLEQVTRNCDILYRQMVAFRAQVEPLLRPHLHDVDRTIDCWCGAAPDQPHRIV